MNFRDLRAIVWLIAVIMLAYASSFKGLFFLDDDAIFRSGMATWPALSDLIRPGRSLVNLSFTANIKAHGYDPWGFHLVNLAIHILSALTIWSLSKWGLEQLNRWRLAHNELPIPLDTNLLSWTIAAIWAVHPLTTESVTYVIQRYESMAVLFMLLCLRCWCGIMEGKAPFLLGVFLFAWCAALSKEISLALPFFLIAWEYFFGKYLPNGSPQSRRALWLLKSTGAVLILTAWVSQFLAVGGYLLSQTEVQSTSKVLPAVTVGSVSPWGYLKTQSFVIFHYLKLVFFPIALRLDYGWPPVQNPMHYVPCMIALVLIGLVGLNLWRLRRPVGLLIVMCFIALAPRSSFIPSPDMVFEHRMHFPLLFVVATMQVGLLWLAVKTGRPRRVFTVTSLAFILVFGCRTHLRNQDYHSELVFWTKNYQLEPNNPRVSFTLGMVYANANDWLTAKELFRTAVEKAPTSSTYWLALGDTERELGNENRAIQIFSMVIDKTEQSGPALQRRGYLLETRGDLKGAERDYRRAVELEDAEATFNLALLLSKRGDLQEAKALCQSNLSRAKLVSATTALLVKIRQNE